MSRPFVREITPKRLFFKDCPRYPEVPSAKSRVGVRDIPSRPGAISDQIQNKRRKATGYRGHWPEKSREIADGGPAKAREIADAANRLGISRTKRKARDIADVNSNRADAPVARSSTAGRCRVGRCPTNGAEGPVAPAGGRCGCPRPTQAAAPTRRQGCAGEAHPGRRRSKVRRTAARQRSREGQGSARRRDIADFNRRERGAALPRGMRAWKHAVAQRASGLAAPW